MILFQIIGLFILFTFYGGYFLKMVIQSKKGIKTDRMVKGEKEKKTFIFEIGLKITTYLLAFIQVASILSMNDLYSNKYLIYVGLPMASVGVMVFIIAMMTMRDSWRAGIDVSQETTIIKTGIYKYSRNPAFVGFDLLYIGVAIAFTNIILVSISVIAVIMLHFQIIQEEKYLPLIFGDEYKSYKMHTPRYFLFL